MKNTFLISIIILLMFSCKRKVKCYLNETIRQQNDSIISSIFDNSNNQKYWRKFWGGLKEPNLKNEELESYRLTIHNIMDRSSQVYRINKKDKSFELTVKYSKKLNFKTKIDTLIRNDKFKLTQKDWVWLSEELESINFWNLPVKDDRSGLDGATWFIEGRKLNDHECSKRKYHLVARWVPVDTTNFMILCKKIIDLEHKK